MLSDYEDGVWNIDISQLPDLPCLASAMAAAGIKTSLEDPLEIWVEVLLGPRALLIATNGRSAQ